jgi:hypothetical protein
MLHGTLADNEALTSEGLVAYTYTEVRTRTPILKDPAARVPPRIIPYGAPQRFSVPDQLHIPILILATGYSGSSPQVEIRPWLFSTMGGGMHLSRAMRSANITGARGYSNGDNITVVGWKRDENTMIVVHYYGGPKERLVQNLARQIPDYRRFSGILMFGAAVVYLGTVLMSNRKRRWKYD